MKKIDHKYSGDESKSFWKRVNAIPRSGQSTCHGEVYSLGCALQNLEEQVVSALQRAEAEARLGVARR